MSPTSEQEEKLKMFRDASEAALKKAAEFWSGMSRKAAGNPFVGRRNRSKTFRIFFGHHKCGTQWMSAILSHLCERKGLKFERVSWRDKDARQPQDLARYIRENKIDVLAFLNSHYKFVPDLPPFRGFHLVRDPRDVCVSAYFSHFYSHPIGEWKELQAHRDRLQQCSKEEGLLSDMQFNRWIFDGMESWNYRHPDILEMKMEDLAREPEKMFFRIFDFLGFESPGMFRKEELAGVIRHFDFEFLSGGRKPGEENVLHHYRSGVAGEWTRHFGEIHRRYFSEHYRGALAAAGYPEEAVSDLKGAVR